jgi:hypothetical protein
MLDDDRGLLVRGIAAARAGDIDEAKKYLEWALRRHPSMDVEFDVYFWLAKIETDPARKREQLESALAINPLEPPVEPWRSSTVESARIRSSIRTTSPRLKRAIKRPPIALIVQTAAGVCTIPLMDYP